MTAMDYWKAFSIGNIIFAMAGAVVLWGIWRSRGFDVAPFVPISDLLESTKLAPHWKYLAKLAIFVALGSIIGIALTQPGSPAQAVTAGFGWTGFFSVPRRRKA